MKITVTKPITLRGVMVQVWREAGDPDPVVVEAIAGTQIAVVMTEQPQKPSRTARGAASADQLSSIFDGRAASEGNEPAGAEPDGTRVKRKRKAPKPVPKVMKPKAGKPVGSVAQQRKRVAKQKIAEVADLLKAAVEQRDQTLLQKAARMLPPQNRPGRKAGWVQQAQRLLLQATQTFQAAQPAAPVPTQAKPQPAAPPQKVEVPAPPQVTSDLAMRQQILLALQNASTQMTVHEVLKKIGAASDHYNRVYRELTRLCFERAATVERGERNGAPYRYRIAPAQAGKEAAE